MWLRFCIAVAVVYSGALIRSLAWELPCVMGAALKSKKKKKKGKKKGKIRDGAQKKKQLAKVIDLNLDV